MARECGCRAAHIRGPGGAVVFAGRRTVVPMSEPDPRCDLCDLPLSQCVHGQPPPPKPVMAPPKPRKRAPARTAGLAAPTKPVNRRWSRPEDLKPFILAVLRAAGGELDADDLFLELEIAAEDHLRPGDRETTPTGELRWHYAARRARVELINDGLMTSGTPGVWRLA